MSGKNCIQEKVIGTKKIQSSNYLLCVCVIYMKWAIEPHRNTLRDRLGIFLHLEIITVVIFDAYFCRWIGRVRESGVSTNLSTPSSSINCFDYYCFLLLHLEIIL